MLKVLGSNRQGSLKKTYSASGVTRGQSEECEKSSRIWFGLGMTHLNAQCSAVRWGNQRRLSFKFMFFIKFCSKFKRLNNGKCSSITRVFQNSLLFWKWFSQFVEFVANSVYQYQHHKQTRRYQHLNLIYLYSLILGMHFFYAFMDLFHFKFAQVCQIKLR